MKKLLTFLILTFLMLTFSCKKSADKVSNSLAEKYFEMYVIGNDFAVTLAKDSTTDLTADYKNYKFVLLETDLLHGPLKATSGTDTYMGTWQTNADYGKLDISFPDSISVLKFLSRSWRFTKKANPTLELAPWGTTAPIVLHMTRQ